MERIEQKKTKKARQKLYGVYQKDEMVIAGKINAMRVKQRRLREDWILADMRINMMQEMLRKSFARRGLDYDEFAQMHNSMKRMQIKKKKENIFERCKVCNEPFTAQGMHAHMRKHGVLSKKKIKTSEWIRGGKNEEAQ